MAKIKIGDIFEINTPAGNAYLHYVYNDKQIGDLIKVLPGIYSERPDNLAQLAASKEKYIVFFPLSAAFRNKIVENVGHLSLKDFVKPHYMRSKHIVRGEFLGWHIIDTNTMHRQLIKDLTNEQKKLSPWGIWNDTLLIERLTDGWSLEVWD
jgi:hypothetical protein